MLKSVHWYYPQMCVPTRGMHLALRFLIMAEGTFFAVLNFGLGVPRIRKGKSIIHFFTIPLKFLIIKIGIACLSCQSGRTLLCLLAMGRNVAQQFQT